MKIIASISGVALSSLLLSGVAIAQEAVDADALAKELSNPGGALSSMGNKMELRWYDGDLPGANKQRAYTYVFQPVLPFPTAGGDTIIFRPGFSYLIDQPYFNATLPGFDQAGAFGDISFDLFYSFGNIDPFVFGVGMVGNIPTGTDSRITSDNWLLGPEVLFAKKFEWGIAGFLAFHNTKVAGNGADFNVTSFQPLVAYSLGDGVTIGPSSTISYNWNAASDQAWTVPIGVSLGKATTLNGQPIKYGLSIEYNAIRPDAFAQTWKATFSITPVVKNPFLR